MKCSKIILVGLLFTGFAACEKDLPVYESSVAQLNFLYGNDSDLLTDGMTETMSQISHSFIMDSKPNQEVDTVWVTVLTMGYLSDQDRPFELQQVMTGGRDAVAGTHYLAFDSPEMQDWYIIPGGEASRQIPIVVMRDPSLAAEGDVVLEFTFKENAFFQLGYPEFSTYTLTISDQLAQPASWAACGLDSYFGKWGAVKHSLMIEWTGEAWNDEYIESLFRYVSSISTWYPLDSGYMNYLSKWFAEKLAEANEERLNDPAIGEKYKESDGSEVDFTPVD